MNNSTSVKLLSSESSRVPTRGFPGNFLFSVFCFLLCVFPVYAQTGGTPGGSATLNLDSLLTQTAASLNDARKQGLDLLSPRHFEKAQSAYDEARALTTRKSQQELVRIRLKSAQDELQTVHATAASAQQKLGEALDARLAALAAGADSVSESLWKKADERFRDAVRELEKSPTAEIKSDDLAGGYRAARRDALRTGILRKAREKLAELDRKGGEKELPVLLLRAQQAMSRAESEVAQEKLDAAKINAWAAEREAIHALSLLDYLDKVRKTKQPWENAILPYDQMIDSLAQYLGGSLDYSRGIGVYALSHIIALINARQDSLAALTVQQKQSITSLEASLSDAQTKLTDANSTITELQNRLGMTPTPAQGAAAAELVGRAQSVFQPGEAFVLQGTNSSIIIRLAGSLFASGATKIEKTRQKILDRAADAIGLFPGAAIRLEGHTDSVGTLEKNQTISTERAVTVAGYLAAKLNIPAEKIAAQGFASTRPVATNETAEGRTKNRRIDIVLTFAK